MFKYWGCCSITNKDKALALDVTHQGSVPSTPHGPLISPGAILDHRTSSNPRTLPGIIHITNRKF